MARLKIDYGIDLGTTNSAICRMEKGIPVIIKSDTLKDTMPSCVAFTKRQTSKVGDSAFNDMKSDKKRATKTWKTSSSNTYVEFKRTMGTDKTYQSAFMSKDFTSEELSSEVLKTLKSFVTDENFSSVVITVPAKFTVNQKTATMEAAKLAGFDHCELLQEPIAASMAYGLTSEQKNGYWMVFDFGGGTFDAALLKVEDGIMSVFDTEGDNYLGGKNLDYAIVDDIIIPYLQENYSIDSLLGDPMKKEVLRDAMKTYAEEVKNQLSFKEREDIISNLGDLGEDEEGEEIELDLSVTQAQAYDAMRPYFQKAVDICKDLLKRNNMSGNQVDKLILVGGPTHSPLVRQMLKEQVTPNVDTSIDPMTAVATGAALYASTKNAEIKDNEIEIGTIRLNIDYPETTVESTIWASVILDKAASGANCPDKVYVELVSADKSWSSGKTEVNEAGNVIEAQVKDGKANNYTVMTYDASGNKLKCFPEEITIIGGTVVSSAPLPYHIGIAVWNNEKEKIVFLPLTGLEKNKPLPAVGVRNDRKTSTIIRPEVSTDKLTIPVYQADNYNEGTSAYLYEYVTDVIVDGSEVECSIPEGSPVEVTVKADSSEMMTMEVYFPSVDITVTKQLDTSKKQSIDDANSRISKDITDAQRNINSLSKEGVDTTDIQALLNSVKDENNNSSEKKAVLQHLKEVLRKIEDRDSGSEWDRVCKDLKRIFKEVEEDQKKYGDFKTEQMVEQFRGQVDDVIRKKDLKMAKDLYDLLHAFDYKLAQVEYFISWIYRWDREFDSKSWSDRNRARQLLNQGITIINDAPTAEKLDPIVGQLIRLLPRTEQPNGGSLLS